MAARADNEFLKKKGLWMKFPLGPMVNYCCHVAAILDMRSAQK
jgi:hypothetical protein